MTKLPPYAEALIYLFILNPASQWDGKLAKAFIPKDYDCSDESKPTGLCLGSEDYDKAHGNYPTRPMLPEYCISCGSHYGLIPNGRILRTCPLCKKSYHLNDAQYKLTKLSTALGVTEVMLSWITLNLIGGHDA